MGNGCFNPFMDLPEIRRQRLRKLIDERYSGVDARLAAKIERQPAQVARLFMTNKHKRDIGEKLARHIERANALPAGWLDAEEENNQLSIQQPLAIYNIHYELQTKLLELFDGLTEAQQEDMIDQLQALKTANESIVRELGGRMKTVSRQRAAERLPPAPKAKAKP
jgi:hypothetical protein